MNDSLDLIEMQAQRALDRGLDDVASETGWSSSRMAKRNTAPPSLRSLNATADYQRLQASTLETSRWNAEQPADERRSRRRLAMLKRSGLFGQSMEATIERAQCFEDLRDAYRLVHDVYLESGYIDPDPAGLRMRMFEATAEMATFVAKVGGKVVGVLSIAGDSPELGLPSDAAFRDELDRLRATGARLCEWTNQVIAAEHRKSGLATELMRCAAAHVIYAEYDESIATVSPSHGSFYELLGYREVGSERSYSETIFDPVVALSLESARYTGGLPLRDEAAEFVRQFMAISNPYLDHVADWDYAAEEQFGQIETLRQLFVTESNFIDRCLPSEWEILRDRWGKNVFDSVTGRTFIDTIQEWFSSLPLGHEPASAADSGSMLDLSPAT